MQKRGQAALEFLMTYGWAILAIVTVAAALAAFGVFRPKTQNVCGTAGMIETGISCPDFKISTEPPYLEVMLINGLGEDITIINIWAEIKKGTLECEVRSSNIPPINKTYSSIGNEGSLVLSGGEEATFALNKSLPIACMSGFTAGSSFKGDIMLSYNRVGISHTIVAPLRGTVEKGTGYTAAE